MWYNLHSVQFDRFIYINKYMHVCCAQSCPTLCSPMNRGVCQAPLSMEFSRHEYWRGLPHPSPGDLLDPRITPLSLTAPAWVGGFFIAMLLEHNCIY